MLTTKEFKDRMAHFKGSEHESTLSISVTGMTLNQSDLKEILNTIRESNALSQTLKDSVKDIKLD